VILKDVSIDIPDYVLKARMVSIGIDVCKLTSVRLMVAITIFFYECSTGIILKWYWYV
jgi:hypothetical protein